MLEALTYPFFQKALTAGLLTGFTGSYYGVFVVQRKISFIGSGLAHAAFGGVALGLLLGVEPLLTAVPFTILVAIAIVYLQKYTQLAADALIGVLFALSVALGIIFLAVKTQYTSDAYSYLFGSILTVNDQEIVISLLLSLVTVLTFFKLWARWAYSTFDVELAGADKVPIEFDNVILILLISVTIVISIKIVGIILISAYLVIPPASARLISSSFGSMTVISVLIGMLSSVMGIMFSYILDLPSGAIIVITQTMIFFVIVLISLIKKNKK
ncbi:MAG: metal ABC transporter permease [Candidatus Kapabacteria bacterium]|nr:metal ABC transporter permease [Candidatus Kapabacteria bacterium]